MLRDVICQPAAIPSNTNIGPRSYLVSFHNSLALESILSEAENMSRHEKVKNVPELRAGEGGGEFLQSPKEKVFFLGWLPPPLVRRF